MVAHTASASRPLARPWRWRQRARRAAGASPSPQAERRNPRTGDRGDFQFAAPGHDGSRTDEDPARRMYAPVLTTPNLHNSEPRHIRVAGPASVLCIAVHRAPGPFLCFSENTVKIESTSKLD